MIDNKDPSNNKPHDFEEEFDFDSNELFETGADPLNTVTPNHPSFVERAKWPILIGVIITGFVVWKLYGILFPTTADTQIDQVAAEEAAAIHATAPNGAPPAVPVEAAPAAMPSDVAAPAPSAPVTLPAPAPMPMPAVPVALDSHTQDEIKQLENTVNQVMDSLNKMDQKISLIGREFFAVSDQVTKLSQEMADMKRKPVKAPVVVVPHKPKKQAHPAPKKSQPVYSVEDAEEILEDAPKPVAVEKATRAHRKPNLVIHAIIPGRVWLKAPDGSTFTVTTGENIPGYGKAMVIDAPSASVVTSSGVVLR